MRIPKAKLQEIRKRLDIVEVIQGHGVPLTPDGAGLKGLCPFHEERSASFKVSRRRQRYKCFACPAAGDVFEFVQRREGLTFQEAVMRLAAQAGVELDLQQEGQDDPRPFAPADAVQTFHVGIDYTARLIARGGRMDNEEEDPALVYLAERRLADCLDTSVSEPLVVLLPAGGPGIHPAVSKPVARGYRICGLLRDVRTGEPSGVQLRFAGHALPYEGAPKILSPRGGRVAGCAYMNPSMIDVVRGARLRRIVLGEGQTDHLALSLALPGEAVACVAGAANVRSVLGPKNGCPHPDWMREPLEIVTALDRDPAGESASEVVLGIARQVGVTVRQVSWPTGCKDACDVLKLHGPEALREHVSSAREVKPTTPRISTWSHADLMRAELGPLEWVVDEMVLVGGLTVISAPKKSRKSWLVLQMAQAVARGGMFLDRKTKQGSVIYFCLEDGARRVKQRLQLQSAPPDLPITYRTVISSLDGGGLEELAEIVRTQKPALVILDTFTAAKTAKTDENAAGQMADIFNFLRGLAQETGTGIVVVGHHGKSSSGDPGFDFRGSSAVPGAADVNVSLYRKDEKVTLVAEGRDIENTEQRVRFDAQGTWLWELVGDERLISRLEADHAVLGALELLGEADASGVATELGKNRSTVQRQLKRMRADGTVSHRVSKPAKGQAKIIYLPRRDQDPEAPED